MDTSLKSVLACTLLVSCLNLILPEIGGILFYQKEWPIEEFGEPEESSPKYPVLASLDSPLLTDEKGIVTYIVQPDDTASSIAASFGISTNTVLWTNKLTSRGLIRPGQKLEILPVSGVKHKVLRGQTIEGIAKKYKSEASEIIAFNDLANSQIEPGQILIVPGGRIPIVRATRTSQKYASLPNLAGYFIIPTTGRISQRLHGHNAIDIANSCGTAIYAAASGKVVIADSRGYNRGAGQYLKINHSNGTATLYAHLSKILIAKGQNVSQGQKIGLIGSSGRSTGCHLHWEVWGAKNPLAKYSKYTNLP